MEHLEQLRRSGLFDARVPRYTSYPPVSRFAVAEGLLHQRRWLRTIPPRAPLSLYVHIPYCEKLCWFCVCRTQAAENREVVAAYLRLLLREIELIRREIAEDVTLARLYLGGGTPTLLTPQQMESLLARIFSAFPRAESFECSVEIDTTQVKTALIDSLTDLGMTRAIVGVQDFDRTVQEQIGRRQSFDQTLDVVRLLRKSGLKALDMELLHGLPSQTTASIAETAQQVLALDPDRLAVCEYTHMPNLAKRQVLVDARALPASEDAFLQSQVARQILLTDGYEAVGMDHFVRPGDALIAAREKGTLRRDFQGYSDNSTHALIGLGASAISRFPQGYVQNASATSVYMHRLEESKIAGNRGYKLTSTDLVIAAMIEMLMCRFEIDLEGIRKRFPGSRVLVERAARSIDAVFGPYIDLTPDLLTVKPMAHPLARMISNILDRIGYAESEAY